MPDYFSHYIAAEQILENLGADEKRNITSHTLYLIGAQGGDVFFTYNYVPTKNNLGRELHRRSAYDIISLLAEHNPTYAAGFASHYALDCMLHPAVYAYENTRRSLLAHFSFEGDLGLYISRLYGARRRIIPREKLLSCTSPVYDCVKNLEGFVTVTGVERCLKRHFSYTRHLLNNKSAKYKCAYPFEEMETSVREAVAMGEECVRAVLQNNVTPSLFSSPFLAKF